MLAPACEKSDNKGIMKVPGNLFRLGLIKPRPSQHLIQMLLAPACAKFDIAKHRMSWTVAQLATML